MPFDLKDVSLEYFPIQGRGEPIRLFLADLGVNWTEAGMKDFTTKKMDYSLYPFNQLPVLVVNGKRLVQLNSILKYLALASGQVGTGDVDEEVVCWQLEEAVEDFARDYTECVYSDEYQTLLVKFSMEAAPRTLGSFEHILKQSKSTGGFFLYNDFPCAPEYHLLYLISALLILRPKALNEFPALSAWYKALRERKGIKAYLESGKAQEILNGNANGNKQYCSE